MGKPRPERLIVSFCIGTISSLGNGCLLHGLVSDDASAGFIVVERRVVDKFKQVYKFVGIVVEKDRRASLSRKV